jgi:hypothetical protein
VNRRSRIVELFAGIAMVHILLWPNRFFAFSEGSVTKFLKIAVCLVCLLSARSVGAYPLLQLDIVDGYYDPVTDTIVSSGPDFTLVALLTPRWNSNVGALLADTYYISAAVDPRLAPPGATLGSFTWNDTPYDVTGDMTYGTPPLEASGAVRDSGDLSPHGIFPTYFSEFSFQFSPDNRTVAYDSQDDPGGLDPTTATNNISYFATFNLTTSLSGDNVLHFDLYDTYIKDCSRNRTCVPDEDIDHFAPFSHDAQSTNSVPEPHTLLTLATGLLFASRLIPRKAR